MPKNIRNLIYELEYLSPTSNTGYSPELFHYYSTKLEMYSTQQLGHELEAMEREGLVRRESKGIYSGTRKGKITRQKILTQRGVLSASLMQQRYHALEDLMLAIVASAFVDPFSGGQHIPVDAFPIYLHEFPDEDLTTAMESLIQAGLLSTEEMRGRKVATITETGLKKYRNESRKRLNLGPAEGILRLVRPLRADPRFDQLCLGRETQDNLTKRWAEMEACAEAKAYLAALIMLGSVVEGALRAKLQLIGDDVLAEADVPAPGDVSYKPLRDWTIAECVAVMVRLGYLSPGLQPQTSELHDTLNWVAVDRHLRMNIVANAPLYQRSREIADAVIDALTRLQPTLR